MNRDRRRRIRLALEGEPYHRQPVTFWKIQVEYADGRSATWSGDARDRRMTRLAWLVWEERQCRSLAERSAFPDIAERARELADGIADDIADEIAALGDE